MTYGILSDSSYAASRLRDLLVRCALRAAGLGLIVLAALFTASLLTWHIDDPSFSYVTDLPARNLLGRPGAAFADLAMQFFGFAVVAVVFPVALVGWNVFRLRPPRHPFRQSLFWVGGVLLLSAALACAPIVANWPLPTGLGGAAGDLILDLPEWFGGGALSGGLYAALFVVLGGLSIGLLWASCVRVTAEPEPARRKSRRKPAPRQAERDEEEDEEGAGGRLRILVGVLSHWGLRTQAQLRRALAKRAASPNRLAEAKSGSARREPVFEADDQGLEEEDDLESSLADALDSELTESGRKRKPAQTGKPAAGGKRKKEARQEIDPDDFELPPLELLIAPPKQGRKRETAVDHAALQQNARLLEGVLEDFGVRGEIINIRPGPVVTLYELEPAPGIKSSRVISLADDIARSMSAISARVAVIPGKNAIGIELPNANRETVLLRELLASEAYADSKAKLSLSLGKTIGGEPVIADLAKMPHLLVAGTTGSGKSVSINTMILSLLYRLTPAQCRLIMIDPKMLELSVYDGIPHLLAPVVTDPRKAIVALKWTVRQMEDRYKKMSKLGVRNIDGFNQRIALATRNNEVLTRTVQTGFDRESGEPIFETEELELEPMPFIVVIIDEMADLMIVAGKDIESAVQRLAQMARAAGIHVIMATQRPSVDVITGTIKANFPTRISFQVTSKIDSRTILGEQGAEQLLGQGDMLYMAGGGRIQRVHGPFVSDREVEDIVNHLKEQGVPDYLDAITEEEDESGGLEATAGGLEESNDLYDQAVAIVLRDRKASTSYIQRRLQIGYNRAASLIERMEKEGVVGQANHAGKREILVGEDAA
jgi:DNA segregation ATPase FtsK/SpoIIIE, S-DNA-T family